MKKFLKEYWWVMVIGIAVGIFFFQLFSLPPSEGTRFFNYCESVQGTRKFDTTKYILICVKPEEVK
jgi:hypothetical protein